MRWWWRLIPRALRERIVLGRIKALLVKAGLQREAVEGIMGGWKTWAGGLVGILTGVLSIVKTVADGDFSFEALKEGLALIAGGFSVIGLGHKADKNTEAIKEQTEKL